MAAFDTHLPVKVLFGEEKFNELGNVTANFGKTAMLITVPWDDVQRETFEKAKKLMQESGVKVVVFDKVIPNPTTLIINEGSEIAKAARIDVIVAVGGGSSIDTAKAIAVGATHPGVAWDYVYINKKSVTSKTLPVIAVTTTSGTGSHVTKYAVFTNPETKTKSTIIDPVIFPRVSIVDPELMLGMPVFITAATGFDAFSHAFESYTNINSNPFIDMLALKAIGIIIENLPRALDDLRDRQARLELAFADTLAGVSIANVGTTLPHSMGQPISAKYPHVSHGMSLAVSYPEFFKLTHDSCVEKFAAVARLFNPDLLKESDKEAAAASVSELIRFEKKTGTYTNLEKLGVKDDSLEAILDDVMGCPDTYVTTSVPDRNKIRKMFLRMKNQ
jgi:alcohol dehydrogenase class IV